MVIGNPPFLGGSKKRRELGDDYFKALDTVFAGRVPGGADLVCYWFDKARVAIENHGLEAAGLVATQAIRAGSNRAVLTAICATSKIVEAWSDESWVNDGAAVRVSLICFSAVVPEKAGFQTVMLNGQAVGAIHADLSGGNELDLTLAAGLTENVNASFEGSKKYGDFDISGDLARQWLGVPNPHGQPNSVVVKPWRNGQDLSQRHSDKWIIDFGTNMGEGDASLFESPFGHVLQYVKPDRMKVRRERTARLWWLHEEARVSMRKALRNLPRYIATPRVSKYRFFVFLDNSVLADTRLNVISRSDDTTFGILSSRMHEAWSLAQASMHGVGNDPTYNAKSCFETFPFPAGLTPADTAHQQTESVEGGALIPAQLREQASGAGLARMSGAILKSEAYEPPASEPAPPGKRMQTANASTSSARTAEMSVRQAAIDIAKAAKKLNDLRENWLNPPEWTHKVPEVTPLGMDKSPYPDRIEPKPGISEVDLKALHKRTLTNLYNAKPAWLSMAHQQLDQAVAAAYGWTDYTSAMPDDEMLKRLLALNLARSAIIFGTTHPQTP
ncbi:MAG: DNA methyltransferase [Rhodoferax sp.]